MIPIHIGIILDGNRRWARARKLPLIEGHRKGLSNLKRIALHAFDQKVKFVTVYAFSNENWNREKNQVADLMQVFREVLHDAEKEYRKEGVRLRFIGRFDKFPQDIQDQLLEDKDNTLHGDRGTLIVCLGYGGRQEIIDAVKKMLKRQDILAPVYALAPHDVTEETIQKNLYAPDIPDPDLIIRTGGQKRLSGFLTWQTIYSELFFTDTLWPDFSPEELDIILQEFSLRQRNYGK